MRTAFGTVVYHSAWKYLNEFCKSLNEQTTQEFTVLIVCDNLPKPCIQELKQKLKQPLILIPITEKRSIPDLRVTLIKKSKQYDFDLLILGDFDDIFQRNRVEKIKQMFKLHSEYAFFYNQLVDFSGKEVFSILPKEISGINRLLESNFCGLSNTALNMQLIDDGFIDSLFEGETRVFDWYLFSRIILSGGKGQYVADTKTLYRIHENNVAGISVRMQQDYEKELSIKKVHYNLLKKKNPIIYNLYKLYDQLTIEMIMIEKSAYRNQILHGYWWELIKLKQN